MSYASSAALALRLITKKGSTVTLRRLANSTQAEETCTPKGLKLDYKVEEVDGTHIKRGDVYILVAATDPQAAGKDFEPYNEATVDGELWTVVKANKLKPGDTLIMWTIQLRK